MNIAFTGHRIYDPNSLERPLLDYILEQSTLSGGVLTFWCGMALGFDMAAGEAVIEAQRRGADVRLNCVIPFEGHGKYLKGEELQLYQQLIASSHRVITLADNYSRDVFHRRNDYLLEQADMVLAYHNGTKKGGTAYTIRHATKLHIPILNLLPEQQLSLW